MTTFHLRCLDAFASAASGQPTRVYVAAHEVLDNALGQATYAPLYRCHCVWLDEDLMPNHWRQDQLVRVFWHEIGHIAANHCNPNSPHWPPDGAPVRAKKADRLGNSVLGQALLAQREVEADAKAGAIRNSFPIKFYSVPRIIAGREIFTP